MVAERDRLAAGAGARGAPDAVDIGLGDLRQLEIDDVGHAVDVDTARSDVGRNHHAGFAVAEGGERPLALTLALVAVNCGGVDARLV